MGFATSAKNLMLDALTGTNPTAPITHASLHSAYPGDTGASEISGGAPAYARKVITFGAAAAGAKDSSVAPVFDVPAATTIFWLGYWSAVTAGTYRGSAPLGSTGFTAMYVADDDLAGDNIEAEGHGLAIDDRVVFEGGVGGVPTGITEGTAYWVITATADDLQVSATQSGASITITAVGSGFLSKIVPETFASQGTYTLDDADLTLNLTTD